jgi:hypothetical protein
LIFSGIFFYLSTERCLGEEESFELSFIDEPTYKLKNTFEKNGRILGKSFQIDVIIGNSGNSKSDEIEINLTDQEGFILSQRTFFKAGESKTITFNWSTMNIRNQELYIRFYPSKVDTIRNKFNSGQKTFTIKVVDKGMSGTSTPGFEIFLLLSAIICFTYILRKRN